MGFNSFPQFPDQWVKPEGGGWGETTDENLALYMKRCYPDIGQITARIAEVRKNAASKGLKDIYIMTNGDREWVKDLKAALKAMGGWDKIASSRDMTITKEQKEVAQAVDMMIGERAQVVIGNGVSFQAVVVTRIILTINLLVVKYDFKHRHDEDGKRYGGGQQSFLVAVCCACECDTGFESRCEYHCLILGFRLSYIPGSN